MAIRIVEQGIQAIQGGNHAEGARLLRIALIENEMDARLRATTLMWLAETNEDVSFKIDCYRQAIQADPDNPDVQQRLNYWLSQQLPKAQPPQQNVPQQNPNQGGGYQQTAPQQPPQSMPPGTATVRTSNDVTSSGTRYPRQSSSSPNAKSAMVAGS